MNSVSLAQLVFVFQPVVSYIAQTISSSNPAQLIQGFSLKMTRVFLLLVVLILGQIKSDQFVLYYTLLFLGQIESDQFVLFCTLLLFSLGSYHSFNQLNSTPNLHSQCDKYLKYLNNLNQTVHEELILNSPDQNKQTWMSI